MEQVTQQDRNKRYYRDNRVSIRAREAARRNTLVGRMSAIISNAKPRARREGWAYDLSPKFLREMWSAQSGLCAISGVAMNLAADGKRWSSDLVSLDRKDSTKGYTRDNVWLVSQRVNYAKGVQTYDQFVEMCKAVVEVAQ